MKSVVGRRSWLLAFAIIAVPPAWAPQTDIGDRDPSGAWVLDVESSEGLPPAAGPDDELLADAKNLVIRLTGSTVTFYQPDGSRRVYRTSGVKERAEWRTGSVVSQAKWDGSTFRLDLKTARGLHVVEIYAVDPASGRLTVTVVPGGRNTRWAGRIRRVYDPIRSR
jgi:hypothetical protein